MAQEQGSSARDDPLNESLRGCECTECDRAVSRCAGSNAPVAKKVRRDGEEIKVCTRCELGKDETVEVLIDEDTPAQPYTDYDSLGAMSLSFEVNDA